MNAIVDQQRQQPAIGRLYALGARVASKAVGRCPAFVGAVESYAPTGYNVRSDAGGLWYRDLSDLTAEVAEVAA